MPPANTAQSIAAGWTDDRVQALRTLHKEGLSSSQIAKRLSVTRNAAIGKLCRLRLMGGGKGMGRCQQSHLSQPGRKSPRLVPVDIGTGHIRTPPSLPPRALPCSGAFDLTPDAIPLIGRPFGACAWPVGTPERPADQLCCGYRTGGRTYCASHEAMRSQSFGRGVYGDAKELLHAVRKVA
jgi:GcrA cell cycle regulator